MTGIAAGGPRRENEPWTFGEITQAVVLQFVSVVLLAVAWYGASGTGDPDDQLSWICLGVLAVVVCGAANATVLLSASRALRVRRSRSAGLFEHVFTVTTPVVTNAVDGERVALRGSKRFHRPACRLVADKAPVERGDLAVHVRAGRSPCGWCEA